jgi:DNA excision repair protein ERCC-2
LTTPPPPPPPAACRSVTASWVRSAAEHAAAPSSACHFFQKFDDPAQDRDAFVPKGVYSIEEMKQLGQDNGWCPYFTSRYLLRSANVIVYNYSYLLDPKVSNLISRDLEENCIIVFDEAHNIDNVCIEALSVSINTRVLDGATRNLAMLRSEVQEYSEQQLQSMQAEYDRLVSGLAAAAPGSAAAAPAAPLRPEVAEAVRRRQATDFARGGPIPGLTLSAAEFEQLIPGDIRKAASFVSLMRRVVEFFKEEIKDCDRPHTLSMSELLKKMCASVLSDARTFKFVYDRLKNLLNVLRITRVDDHTSLSAVADFVTLLSSFADKDGFIILKETSVPDSLDRLPDPLIQLCCLDASICMKPIFDRFRNVVITSGTISPMDLYPKILNFRPVVSEPLGMSMARCVICPMVITRGSDQVPLSSAWERRDDRAIIRDYGMVIIELASVVPDGMVCFFPSYSYLESVMEQWGELHILEKVSKHKLVFVETKDQVETSMALSNFQKACDCGRGGVFLSIARGKVAEGIDFDRHYGRCVVLLGVPFQNPKSKVLIERLTFMRNKFNVLEADFLTFDAMRQAAQCVGRVIRSKMDYGIMVFADRRYNKQVRLIFHDALLRSFWPFNILSFSLKQDKKDKLPKWIMQHLEDKNSDLSTDGAVGVARDFLVRETVTFSQKILCNRLLFSRHCLAAVMRESSSRKFVGQNGAAAVRGGEAAAGALP